MSNPDSPVVFEVNDGVATITLNRPEQMNTINGELGSALIESLREVRNRDDIRVAVDGNLVSISTEVKEEKEATGKRTLVRELYVGTSARSFTLPHEVDAKAAVAKYDNGVLTLLLPRATESASRTLKIE